MGQPANGTAGRGPPRHRRPAVTRALYADLPRHTDIDGTERTSGATKWRQAAGCIEENNQAAQRAKEIRHEVPSWINRHQESREQALGYLAWLGFQWIQKGRRNGRSTERGFRFEVWLPIASGSRPERERVMMEQISMDLRDQDAVQLRGTQAPLVRFEKLLSFRAPTGLADGGANLSSARWRESSPEGAALDARPEGPVLDARLEETLLDARSEEVVLDARPEDAVLDARPEDAVLDARGRCRPRQNPACDSLQKITRDLAQIWRLMLALRIDEALRMIEQLELRLDDVPPADARRLRGATQLLRAAGFAFQDDSLGVLPVAVSLLKRGGTNDDNHAALTLCRLGFWRLGEFDCFSLLPRLEPRARWSKSLAISAMLDLTIEAAVALDHLRMSTAKRLALDALNIAKSTPEEAAGLATIPACVAAQVLYEEGCVDQADTLLRDLLPTIKARGPIECVLRAYQVLTRIARQRKQCDLAAALLREAEALGERRGWPRLVAVCLAERASLLMWGGRTREARIVLEYLDRYAESHRSGSGHSAAEVTRYRTLTRWRVYWAETRSREAVAGLRQLYHQALEKQDLYFGCGLAVELAEMLAATEEREEADALFFHTVKAASAAGLYQVFVERGPAAGTLLKRAYDRAAAPASADREVLPFVGSLLSRWDARNAGRSAEQPRGRAGDTLTARERDVLAMIGQGFANKRIARTLEISPETVKSHVKRIFSKLSASTRTEAVCRAGSLGLM
jgi:DNA-binding CsgD family transcriptional regulator